MFYHYRTHTRLRRAPCDIAVEVAEGLPQLILA